MSMSRSHFSDDYRLVTVLWSLTALAALVVFGLTFGTVAYSEGTFTNKVLQHVGLGTWPETVPGIVTHTVAFMLLTFPAGAFLFWLVFGEIFMLGVIGDRPGTILDLGAMFASLGLLLIAFYWSDWILALPAVAYLAIIGFILHLEFN